MFYRCKKIQDPEIPSDDSGKVFQLVAAACASIGFLCIGLMRAWASTAIPSINGNDCRNAGNVTRYNQVSQYAEVDHYAEVSWYSEVNQYVEVNQYAEVSRYDSVIRYSENNNISEDCQYALPQAPLDSEIQSWIVSVPPLGAMFGSLTSSLMLNYLGRRSTVMIGGFAFLASFILTGLASTTMILVGRIGSGVGVGISTPSVAVYIAESSKAELRGRLGSLPAVFLSFGCLLGYIAGSFLPWHFLSYFCAVFPFILVVLMLMMPETPAWFIATNKEERAEAALKWLRGGNEDDVNKELDLMRQKANERTVGPDEGLMKELVSRKCVQPLLLTMALMFLQNWSGVNVLIFNTVAIFEATGTSFDPYLGTNIVGVVQLGCTFLSIFLIDRSGRRPLLMISGLTMTVSMSCQGLFFYLDSTIPPSLDWLPVLSIILSFVGFSLGYNTIPYLIIGELLPARTRNITSALSSSFNLINLFIMLKLFSTLNKIIGYHGVFWLYASINLVGVIFVFCLLPETKGKTLAEIEKIFTK